jgi:hypothetical protein
LFFLKSPVPLWFLAGGVVQGTDATICVSVTYQISASVGQVSDVEIELSTFPFYTSARIFEAEDGTDAISVQANIDLNDDTFPRVTAQLSVTPVFVIDQTGMTSVSATFNLPASVSITASLGIDVVPVLTYQFSASITCSVLIADNICVSVNYALSVIPNVQVQVQAGEQEKSISPQYGISVSIAPRIAIVNQGGLVWSLKKQKYIAVRVGSVTS